MVGKEQWKELVNAAKEARAKAYAPYSDYNVGAAVLTGDGRIFSGANVENASFGLTICAEQSAVSAAVTAGYREVSAMVVTTENAGSPCGACRQVLNEFAKDIPIWLVDTKRNIRQTTLHTLLPDHFGPKNLLESNPSSSEVG